MENEESDAVQAAAQLAKQFHKGQVDKAGKDYFEGHLCTVSSYGENWKEQAVGYLHDVAEDTPHTVSETIHLLQDKCPNVTTKDWDEIETALNLMNSHTAANREAYINRFRNNTLAIRVKLNDLRHNMDISRIPNPTEKDMARIKKYHYEYEQLKKMLE